MKRLATAMGLIAVLFMLVPSALPASSGWISQSCAQYCRTVCIANGETCCFVSPTTCGCC